MAAHRQFVKAAETFKCKLDYKHHGSNCNYSDAWTKTDANAETHIKGESVCVRERKEKEN